MAGGGISVPRSPEEEGVQIVSGHRIYHDLFHFWSVSLCLFFIDANVKNIPLRQAHLVFKCKRTMRSET